MIWVYLLSIFLLGLSFLLSKKNIFSPGVITSAVWFVCLTLFMVLKHKLPPLSEQFLVSLSLWMTLLTLSSLFIQSIKFSSSNREPSQFIRDIYYYISLATFPLLLYFAYNAIVTGVTGNWAMDLRIATLGKVSVGGKVSEAYTPFYFLIWNTSYLIELYFLSKENRKRFFVIVALCLSFGVLTMSKAMILNFFAMTGVLLFIKQKINTKQVLISISLILTLFVFFQSIRHSKNVDDNFTEDMLVTYAIGSMSSFETLIPNSVNNTGENVFRLYYVFKYKLGLTDKKPIDPILPWIQKPIATNTYTCMYPYFKDFGYVGVIIFSVLLGLFYGYLFKKAQLGDLFFILYYTYFVYVILMQFSGDVFFTNLAGHIKMLILLYLPFFANKYKIFSKKQIK